MRSSNKRKYDLKQRAERQADTRRRITEAAVELHGTVGPARTTISEIAARAGVQRLTVYNHFPDEASLLAACSGHWRAANPPPDPSAWAEIRDPRRRLRVALGELYAYYRRVEPMFSRTLRDADSMPALRKVVDAGYGAMIGSQRELLAKGWGARGRRRERLQAALALVLEFSTWRSLARGGGLTDADAAELGARMVECAAPKRKDPPDGGPSKSL